MILYQGKLPEFIWEALEQALGSGLALQGDFSRAFSREVAFAASMGWLSVINTDGLGYKPKWHITASGLTALEHREDYELEQALQFGQGGDYLQATPPTD